LDFDSVNLKNVTKKLCMPLKANILQAKIPCVSLSKCIALIVKSFLMMGGIVKSALK
jgi:hypothetical protein